MKKICFTIIVVILLIGNSTVANAITYSELEQKRMELKAKIDEADKNLEEINIDLTENLEAINNLDKDIYVYEEQIKNITQNINEIERKINETETNLETIEARYAHQKELLETRLVNAYEAGPTRYLDVLLNSKSIVDFISKYYLIADVLEYDKGLLESIENEKIQITEIENSLIASRDNLKTIRIDQKKLMTDLENAKVERSSYINKLTEREKEIQKDLETYNDELELVEVEIQMATINMQDVQFTGGTFEWPVPGYHVVTSPYGMRFHPILKTYRVHTGTDIGAPTGTYAIAANDGLVTTATYSSSYGNMIIIDHGGGISTLYAHASELIAHVGDVVKRGDPILKVGSTGWSTGPHLHFEIRVNGQAIDAYPYITDGVLNIGQNDTEQKEENVLQDETVNNSNE